MTVIVWSVLGCDVEDAGAVAAEARPVAAAVVRRRVSNLAAVPRLAAVGAATSLHDTEEERETCERNETRTSRGHWRRLHASAPPTERLILGATELNRRSRVPFLIV